MEVLRSSNLGMLTILDHLLIDTVSSRVDQTMFRQLTSGRMKPAIDLNGDHSGTSSLHSGWYRSGSVKISPLRVMGLRNSRLVKGKQRFAGDGNFLSLGRRSRKCTFGQCTFGQ